MQSTVVQFYHAACAVLMAHHVYSKQLSALRPHRRSLRGVTEPAKLRGQRPGIEARHQKNQCRPLENLTRTRSTFPTTRTHIKKKQKQVASTNSCKCPICRPQRFTLCDASAFNSSLNTSVK